MKVKELINILEEVDENLEVIISEDREGNYYSPLDAYFIGQYKPNNTWSGEVVDEEYETEKNSIILLPVN